MKFHVKVFAKLFAVIVIGGIPTKVTFPLIALQVVLVGPAKITQSPFSKKAAGFSKTKHWVQHYLEH